MMWAPTGNPRIGHARQACAARLYFSRAIKRFRRCGGSDLSRMESVDLTLRVARFVSAGWARHYAV
jgi:hypothetical protein